eukprot:TRINITY_DN17421_c0_g1_i1.p1 TRINITY_DN17421_c0_g1~~TRINITY_DN17421_c0_g1_i1.p1  ORF type:complete len:1167 (+),score=245.82 TRINITY_DN17421_c0_g1_i1:17-3517(+)
MDFLADDNIAGVTLLRLVSRGNAIISELLRLSEHVPPAYKSEDLSIKNPKDRQTNKYAPVIFDFGYLKTAEYQEHKIKSSLELEELDEDCRETHMEILKRYYLLFESIYKYIIDLIKFLDDLEQGIFIQLTMEMIFMNTDGKQLMCESLYLYGVMLTLMDDRIEGSIRERLLVSYLRYKGQSEIELLHDVCTLCGSTGYLPGQLNGIPLRKPPNYPEELFSRVINQRDEKDQYQWRTFVEMVIGRLRSDDIYNQIMAYPSPEHRSTALATQACMLFLSLYFAPNILHDEAAVMREIVDKHFADNWVLSFYLGFTIDLSIAWAPYKSATLALNNTINLANVKSLSVKHVNKMDRQLVELKNLLTEGKLTKDFILDSILKLLNHLRDCNTSIRWLLLHTTTLNKKFRDIVSVEVDLDKLLEFILKTAQFEFILKTSLQSLLETKQDQWGVCQQQSSERMKDLGNYFSGENVLVKVKKNENLKRWFYDIAEKVNLSYSDATSAGRKIQLIIQALEEVEQYDQIDTNLQVKQYIKETSALLRQMIRIVNIKEEYLVTMATVGDISYAWQIIHSFIPGMQSKIKRDPAYVLLLRATFLKLSSILHLPLVRINQAQSPDFFSVSEFYSGELVGYVRRVLEVIPQTMFITLSEIIDIQTNRLHELPTKIEKERMKEVSQLEERYKLAKATHDISVFTEGILAMETTLVGIIEVDPKKVLEDGIRKELVLTIAKTLDSTLTFTSGKTADFEGRLKQLSATLDGFRRSFEYIQDYVNICGLKIWQEEFSRIINFNVEQECNSFLKKKGSPLVSVFQSKEIPIPSFPPIDSSVNFMGRLAKELINQTDFLKTIYLESGWFERDGREVVGVKMFSLLQNSVGTFGIRGLDKLLCFTIVKELQLFIAALRPQMKPLVPFLNSLVDTLHPISDIPKEGKIYADSLVKTMKLWPLFIQSICKIGQLQLLRRKIAMILNLSCKIESNTLSCALDVTNKALLSSITAHYHQPEKFPYPGDDNRLLGEMSKYLESGGFSDPFTKIYVTSPPLECFSILIFLFILSQMSRFVYQPSLGILIVKNKKAPLDSSALIVGLVTFMKQFHSSYTQQILAFLAQYIRFQTLNMQKEGGKVVNDIPLEVSNIMAVIEELCKYGNLSRETINSYVPPYLFDSFKATLVHPV